MTTQDYRPIELVVKLMTKLGLYFASTDGEYSQSEYFFIDNYINRLSRLGPVDELRYMLNNALNTRYTHDEVVADTRQLLDCFDTPADKQAIVVALANFSQKVILADGVEHPGETQALMNWLQALA